MDDAHHSLDFGRWAIGDRLGRGGTGTVHLAVDRVSAERYAVKFLRPGPDTGPDTGTAPGTPAADARVLRELRTAEALVHPHVVRAHTSGYVHGRYFLLMELCALGSLDQLVRRDGPMDPEAAVAMTLAVLGGLQYAHSAPLAVPDGDGGRIAVRGVVHRDVKPQNLLLTGSAAAPVVKIADFGLAKPYELAGASGVTHTGSSNGTPAFMPRQQVVNFKYAKPDVDVWAAAASLYFMLSGRTPRDFAAGHDPWLTVWNTAAVPLAARMPTVPPRLARIVDEALIDDPRIHFPTAAAFRTALEAW
ncbi:serine/threonine-protein kinase [Kitasatospora sp. NPDC056446]|uniref:serine/threonine-protein kinase n=1 Tax=Kitasatospora sp. NPDC056446 TaxID=3345819 RepID=UPI003692314F